MYREEKLIVDLKVKEYNALRLKQMDSTKLIVKLIDNGLPISLTDLAADIIFTKPNQKIIMQSNNITVDNDKISIILLKDCLRMSGKAKMEIELKKDTEIVSSFFIPIFIEPTSKENIQSDNTPNYIETLEDAIVLEKERQKAETLRKNAEANRIQNEEGRSSAEETRITNETTRESAEETRSNNETARQEAEIERINNETSRTSSEEMRQKAYNEIKKYMQDNEIGTHKYFMKATTTIQTDTNFTIPSKYKVGANVLDVYLMGEKLIKTTSEHVGHYKEIGEVGSISNTIQLDSINEDGTSEEWQVNAGEYFEFVVRGEYNET